MPTGIEQKTWEVVCRGCEKREESTTKPSQHWWARTDFHGIFTGTYCEDCYDDPKKYPYRKDDYFDPSYAGERLDDEY
jgi:hypothetical protein